MQSKGVFLREATGLRREWSLRDAFTYNVFSIGGFINFTMLYFLAASPVLYPGGNVLYAILIGAILCIPHVAAYGMLSASMPRSGGDYIFQSRALHPALAFTVGMSGWVIWLFSWNAWGGLGSISVTFSPLLSLLGVATANPAFLAAADWTRTAAGTTTIVVLLTIIGYSFLIPGIRFLAKVNLVVLGGLIVGWLILLAFTVPNSPATFAPAFNQYMAALGSSDTYQSMIAAAKSAGFNVSPELSWENTLRIVPLTYTVFMWFFWSCYNAGEMKKASELKTQLGGMLGAMAFMVLICLTIAFFYLRMIGFEFWNALSYAYVHGTPTASLFPSLPSYTLLPLIMTRNPVIIAVFYIAIGIQYPIVFCLNTLPASRIMLAMSFDRMLPEKIGDVSERFHIPHITYIIGFVLSLAWFFLLYYTQVGTLLFSMVAVSTIAVMLTCLAGIVLPFRNATKAVYSLSPFAKTKVLGLPIITAVGLLGFLANAWMLYYFAVYPDYGAWTWPIGVLVNAAIFGACLVWYYATKYYRKRQGLNLDMVFRQLPPE